MTLTKTLSIPNFVFYTPRPTHPLYNHLPDKRHWRYRGNIDSVVNHIEPLTVGSKLLVEN